MNYYNCCTLSERAVKFNVNHLRSQLGKTKLCAMVKANAYGHGIKMVQLLAPLIDSFGVATVAEAKQIRKKHLSTPILVVGLTDPKWVLWCSKNQVQVTVHSLKELQEFSKKLKGNVLSVHYKINTGLNRIGFQKIEDFIEAYRYAKSCLCFCSVGIFTHFATKQNDPQFIQQQHKNFMEYVSKTEGLCVHCCNSFATIHCPEYHHDMVRCGFALYGWEQGFMPVMSLRAKVLAIHPVALGDTVGYDRTYRFQKDGIVAVVSMGYGDGFDRRNSNLSSVLIESHEAPVIGLVCMDVFMVDVTGIDGIVEGTPVTILGKDGSLVRTPQYYATLLNTSPYEILLKFNHNRTQVVVRSI